MHWPLIRGINKAPVSRGLCQSSRHPPSTCLPPALRAAFLRHPVTSSRVQVVDL